MMKKVQKRKVARENSSQKEIRIPLRKQKIVVLFLVAMGFVALGVWFFQIKDPPPFFTIEMVRVVSVIDILFFGVCAGFILWKLFDNKPGLIINDQGIIDNSSGISAGFVAWKNIKGLRSITIENQHLIIIKVKNAGEIIARQFGIKKYFSRLNNRYFESPVQIGANTLDTNFEELYHTLQEQFAKYRRRSKKSR